MILDNKLYQMLFHYVRKKLFIILDFFAPHGSEWIKGGECRGRRVVRIGVYNTITTLLKELYISESRVYFIFSNLESNFSSSHIRSICPELLFNCGDNLNS